MSNFGAIFIQLQDNTEEEFDEVNAKLNKAGFLFTLRYHKSTPWAQAWADEPEALPFYLKQLADIFSDRRLIGIACQSVVDAIGYWDIVNGEEKRILEYGFIKERTWEKAEGEPLEWEEHIFEGREGYKKGENLNIGEIEPYFSNFDVQKIGQVLRVPGFGVPGPGEKWTKEIFN